MVHGVYGKPVTGADHVRRPGAYAVILDDRGRVACVRAEYDLFLPGGGLEPGENSAAAVVREVREECGLAVEVVGRLGANDEYIGSRSGTEHWLLESEYFRCRRTDDIVHPSEEDYVLEWIPVATAASSMLREGHRRVLGGT